MQDFRTWLQQGELAGQSYRLASPRRCLKGAAGFHAGSQNGVSLDFSDYREYHPGDDIRSLDWNVFGRTDRLTIKLYHEEVAPHVDIVLDASRSMGLVESKPQALLGIGALLATAAAGGNYSWNAFRLGARLSRLERGREIPSHWPELEYEPLKNPGAPLRESAGVLKRQGVRILVSDLLWSTEPLGVLRRFAEGASSVVVVQLLARADVVPPEPGKYRLDDAETGESIEVFVDADTQKQYVERLEQHTPHWNDACRQTGTAFCRLVAEDLLADWRLDPLLRTGIIEHRSGGPAC